MVKVVHAIAATLIAGGAIGCVDGGDSKSAAGVVTPSEAPFGPKIVFDPLARPVPEVPQPNDLLLRREGQGVAWNVSYNAPTELERRIRERLPRLDGFGCFAPISVAFDAPLDLDTVGSESVVVVDVTEAGAHRGEVVALDFGEGRFPITSSGRFWPFDPSEDLPDFLLPRDNEWVVDGKLRRVSHYEVETSTLIVRPREPLRAGSRYAVLLTRAIKGLASEDDEGVARSIRSPFPYKAHAAQTGLVADALELAGIDKSELAFGWTFSVADPAAPLSTVRDGLYGKGPLAALNKQFPAHGDVHEGDSEVPRGLGEIRDTGINVDGGGEYPVDPRDHQFLVQGEFLDNILGLLIGLADGFSVDFDYVDYVVFGTMPSPDVRQGGDNTFLAQIVDGASVETGAPWLIAIPKPTEHHKPPFPVVFYFHGTGSSRFEFLALANNLARQGIATVAYDQIGHGPIVPDLKQLLTAQGFGVDQLEVFLPLLVNLLAPDRVADFEGLTFEQGFDKLSEIGFFRELALIGRTTDQDGDGALTSSESFFFADPFKQCGAFQQDLVDFMQFVRVLRGFSQAAVPPAIAVPAEADPALLMKSMMAGDFNADGVLDLAGPDNSIGTAGTSLGGIHSMMAAAVEPEVTTATPVAAGGGLADVLLRSRLRQITRVIYLEVFGPLVVGCPDGAGGVWLSLNNESNNCNNSPRTSAFANVPELPVGAVVRLSNIDNDEVEEHVVDEAGEGFAIAVPSDRWDQLAIEIVVGGSVTQRVLVMTPHQGLALQRNSPEFRRFVAITQHALDRCDPISFARSLFRDGGGKNVLFENMIGDSTVPISSGLALARAAGVLGDSDTADEVMQRFVEAGVVVGGDYDVDDLLGNNPPEKPRIGLLPAVASGPGGTGKSAIRFAYGKARHEWIAGPTNGAEYEAHTMTRNRIALFHASGGTRIVDDICIADEACELLDEGR